MKADLLVHPPLPADLNMAVDWHLLTSASRPTLRLYRWAQPSLTVGYRQQFDVPEHLEQLVDRWPSAVRPTGGGYLLHAGELTYSIVVPAAHDPSDKSIMEFYELVHGSWFRALRNHGIVNEAERGKGSRPVEDCLMEPAEHELTREGRKWIASAQVRHDGAVLQHGSMFFDSSAWPPDWSGPRPSFVGEGETLDWWDIARVLLRGMTDGTFPVDGFMKQSLSGEQWTSIDEVRETFHVSTVQSLPVFRRGTTMSSASS